MCEEVYNFLCCVAKLKFQNDTSAKYLQLDMRVKLGEKIYVMPWSFQCKALFFGNTWTNSVEKERVHRTKGSPPMQGPF